MDLRRIPVRCKWVGGKRAGYAVLDVRGNEICRVWSERDAKFVIHHEYIKPHMLVDEILAERAFWSDLIRGKNKYCSDSTH